MLEPYLRHDHFDVDKKDELRTVLGWMRGERKGRPVVLDGKHPYGILNKAAFMGSRILDRAAVGKYTRPTPVPRTDAELFDALRHMSEALVGYLPVQKENGTLAGYIDGLDLLEDIHEGPDAAALAHPVPIMRPTDTLGKAINTFRSTASDHLPVVEDGRLVGVLPRQGLIRVELNRTVSAGTGDRASDTDNLMQDTVHDFTESGPIHLPPETSYPDLRAAVKGDGYVLVTHEESNGSIVIDGVVTPEYLVRGLRPISEAPQPGSHHGAGVATQRGSGR